MSLDDQTAIYTVATVGTNSGDNALLEQVFSLTRGGRPAIDAYTFDREHAADIVLIKSDNTAAVNGWRAYCRSNPRARTAVCIWFGSGIPDDEAGYHLPRTASATEVIELLRRIVSQDLDCGDGGEAEAFATSVFAEAGQQSALDLATADAESASSEASDPSIKALLVCASLPTEVQLKIPLQRLSAHIEIARSGEEALVMLAGRRFDIVFIDVLLPGMDGYAVCQAVRADSIHGRTPLVMLTSNSTPADKLLGDKSGCDAYLIKPVHQAMFEEIVRGLLSPRRAA
ncbi:MAG: response regulator [Gammaproteobacteria bacterium]|nr:response regulator [Gammaproteobacteria bacterium]